MSDLISKRTRVAFREHFVQFTLREITDEFDSADVPFDSEYSPPVSGQRRTLVEQYYHAINFSSWHDTQKVLRVYETVLSHLEDRINNPLWGAPNEDAKRTFPTLVSLLKKDGFNYSDGKITLIAHNPAIESLSKSATTFDSNILRQQIDRIQTSIEEDPDLAIGTAKELIETVCKTILADYGLSIELNWDVPRLVKEVRGTLKLVPEDIPESARGAETIKRILANLGQIAQGLSELRNLYGTGHGKDGQFKGLNSRHARLAAGCATTLAVFLFETHEFRKEKAI